MCLCVEELRLSQKTEARVIKTRESVKKSFGSVYCWKQGSGCLCLCLCQCQWRNCVFLRRQTSSGQGVCEEEFWITCCWDKTLCVRVTVSGGITSFLEDRKTRKSAKKSFGSVTVGNKALDVCVCGGIASFLEDRS